jgi:hypothetical protein
LTPTVVLGKECYIKLYLPTDLEYSFESVEAAGMFRPSGNSKQLSTNDLVKIPATSSEPRESILFSGCYLESKYGEKPSGTAKINVITTQRAKMDSGPFAVEIYKDEDMQ